MRILAIDPGGNTGVATWCDGEWEAWAEPADDAKVFMHRQLAAGELSLLIMESFHITANTAKKSQDGLVPIEMIGIGRYLSKVYGIDFLTQSPSEAKTFSTDSKLHAVGFWTKGVDHPRDASRHILLYLCKNKLIDLMELRHSLDDSSGTQPL